MKKNAKRLLSLMLCLMMVLAMLPVAALAADTLRVYCQAPTGWTKCCAYWWGSSVENPGWPGKPMSQDVDGIWYIDIPADTPNIIFNNGSGTQTPDLKVPTDDKLMYVYQTKSWASYGKQEVEEPDPVSVYLINSGKWNSAYVHAWINGGAGTSWPGMEMIKTEDTINGFDIYQAVFDVAYENIIFNNNSGTQTADMAFNANQYYDYAAGKWYTSLDEVPALDPLATGAFLTGDFNGWNTTANEFRLDAEGSGMGSVSLELEANTTYGFKVVNNGSWLSCATPIVGTAEGLVFDGGVSDNAAITTVVAGTYVFSWDVNSSALSVTYPENVCVHVNEVVSGYAATCTEPGLTDGVKCGLCGETLTVQTEIPALGHTFENGSCTVCGTEQPKPVYLINSGNWDGVYAYAWTDGGAGTSWPGAEMIKTEDTVNGFDIYEVVFDTAFEKIIFNNGSGTQTNDLVLNAGQYYDYAANAWYASLDEVPALDPLATGAFLTGDFNGWNTTANEFRLDAEGASVGYVSLELDAGATLGFKIVNNGAWTSCADPIIGDVEGLIFTDSVSDNASITTVAAGTYVFAWDVNTGALSVTYPENVCAHEAETVSGYAATCTEPGLTDGSKCILCGEVFTAQEEIPALGHDFVEGVCSVCGAKSHMTVYFQNNWGWSEVSLYFWGSALEEDPQWPGIAMEYYGYDGTYDIYTLVVPSDIDALIINGLKDDGSGALDQTPDITDGDDGVVYYMAWDNGNTVGSFDISDVELKCKHVEEPVYGYAATCTDSGLTDGSKCGICGEILTAQTEIPAIGHNYVDGTCTNCGDVVVAPVQLFVYLINSGNWDNVYAYAWDSAGNSLTWPGQQMSKTEDTVNGFDVYEVVFGINYESIIFSNGSGTQTNDMAMNVDQYYDIASGNWYTSLDEVPELDPLSTGAFLTGSFNGWDATANEFRLDAEGTGIGYVALELAANTAYEFKVVNNGAWTSCETSITGTVEGLTFSSSVNGNAVINTVAEGVYVFAWTVDGSLLSVTYPENICNHIAETVPGYAATCTEPGLTDGSKCGLCGEIFTVQTEIPALGHDFVEGVCSVCGAKTHMTIYFQNNWGWSDVSLYFWGSSLGENPNWPGIAMEYYGFDGYYDIYALTVPSDATAVIINGLKDDGSGNLDQTPDITNWYDGIVYYMAWDNGNTVGSYDISSVELQCKHSWTDATCAAPKTCSVCGETEGEAVDHSFENGECVYGCGLKYDPTGLKFAGACLSLESDLTVHYKVSCDVFEKSGYEAPYVVFNFNGVETKVTDYTVVGGQLVFKFENVSPDRMNDTILATLYASANGSTVKCETRAYSVATYCYNILGKYNGEKADELKTLIVDLLNYGAESQKYNQYNTDNLVNAALTEEQKAFGTAEDRDLVSVQDANYVTIENPTVAWTCAGLNLKNSVAMRFKVDALSVENLSVKVEDDNGNLITWTNFVQAEDGYYVYLDVLVAAEMSKAICLTAYEGETAVSNTARYSIESYAFAKQNGEDVQLAALVKAMMKYGDAAKAYFG